MMTHEMPWTLMPVAAAPSTDGGREATLDSALSRLFTELDRATDAADRDRLLAELYDEFAADLHGVALWRTGCRDDAADVVQTVFVRLAAGKVRFGRVRKPRLLLLAMAHRAAIDVVRRRRPTVAIEDAPALVQPATADAATEASAVSHWLRTLPAPQREALYLRYFVGLGFREIGAVTGVPTFTAASRCRLGLAALRRLAGGRANGPRKRDDG
jgi:RNA polymerase sigma-70 factor (ECF subfamily)